MANFLDTAGLNALQAFYIDNAETLYEQVFDEPMRGQDFNVINDVKDHHLLMSVDPTEVLQAWQSGFTEKGTVAISARKIVMQGVKVNMKVSPRAYHFGNYLSYLKATNNDAYSLPFEQYFWTVIMRQAYRDHNEKVLWTGVKAAITAGTPTTAAGTADGFKKILDDAVTATLFTNTVTGAIVATTAYAQVTAFAESEINTAAKAAEDYNLYCSLALLRKVQADKQAKFGNVVYQTNPFNAVRGLIDTCPNLTFVPQPGITGDTMYITRSQNLAVGFDGTPSFEVERHLGDLYVMMNWSFGHQVINLADIARNNV